LRKEEYVSASNEKPNQNLGAVFDAHVKAGFVDKDVAKTMATMVAEPYVTHVPTMRGGGTGRAEVESFYLETKR
jgi:carboxymethylenebutenolidase